MKNTERAFPSLIDYVRSLENKSSAARGQTVIDTLEAMGLKPIIQTCRWPHIKNIIVDFLPQQKMPRPLFSAHYDVVKGSPSANDNGSGVAVLLGLCREILLKPRAVRIVFFDREEAWFRTRLLRLGLLGSFYYVGKNDLRMVSTLYNLEFCGMGDFLAIWPVKDKETLLPSVRRIQQAAATLGQACGTAHIPWPFISSDHLSFRLKGFKNAVTLSLLPSTGRQAFDKLLKEISIVRLLTGQRPSLPEPLSFVHSQDDNLSKLDNNSLERMLSLLLELVQAL